MKKLILNPNVSVGPFVFGTEQEKIWEIIKKEFGSESKPIIENVPPAYKEEYHENPHVHLEYKDNRLISVSFMDDITRRYCEIYLGKEKIWPRTEKKFLSIFGESAFIEVFGLYYHTELSLIANWDDNPTSLTIGCKGYSTEIVENFRLFYTALEMKKGMNRKECRTLMNRTPQVSIDGRTDNYPFGIIKPEVTSLTYDSDDRLIKACQSFPDENIIDIRLK